MIRVSLHYRHLKEPGDLRDFTQLVHDGLGAFPLIFIPADLPMTLTVIQGIIDIYKQKIIDAAGGDHLKIKDRDDYRDLTLLPMLDKLARHVEKIADGTALIILDSGFHATKDTSSASIIPVKMDVDVNSPGQGQLGFVSKTKVSAAGFALVGRVQGTTLTQDGNKLIINTTGAAKIVIALLTSKKGTVTGLDSDTKVITQIIPFNTAGAGVASDEKTVHII